jgi:hypothetical protein
VKTWFAEGKTGATPGVNGFATAREHWSSACYFPPFTFERLKAGGGMYKANSLLVILLIALNAALMLSSAAAILWVLKDARREKWRDKRRKYPQDLHARSVSASGSSTGLADIESRI